MRGKGKRGREEEEEGGGLGERSVEKGAKTRKRDREGYSAPKPLNIKHLQLKGRHWKVSEGGLNQDFADTLSEVR